MTPGYGRFEVIFAHFLAARGLFQERLALPDEVRVPLRTVLIRQQAETATLVYPRWHSGGVQTHQCQQCERRGRGGQWMIAKQSGESHGFTAQLDADRRLRVGSVVSLVEQQVQRTMNRCQSLAEVLAARELKQLGGGRQNFLGAR